MISILLGALALFIVACYAFPQWCGVVGEFAKKIMFGLFGGGAIVLPVLLLVEAACLKSDVKEGNVASRPVSSAVAIVFISSLLHAAAAVGKVVPEYEIGNLGLKVFREFYEHGTALRGGGIIGGTVGTLIMDIIGPVGTVIVAALLVLFCAIFVLGISWSDVRMKYAKWQENKAIKNDQKARAAVAAQEKRRVDRDIAIKKEERHLAELEKKAHEERKREEEEERELERMRKNIIAHNASAKVNRERASEIRREIARSKKAAFDEEEEFETDEMPRARKHGDIEEIFQADLIDDAESAEYEVGEDLYEEDEEDGDIEFRGESVEDFWRENETDTETTYESLPELDEEDEEDEEDGDDGDIDADDENDENDDDNSVFDGTDVSTEELDAASDEILPEDVIPWEDVTGEKKFDRACDDVQEELRRTLEIARMQAAGEDAEEDIEAGEEAEAGEDLDAADEDSLPEEPKYIFPPLELLNEDPNNLDDGEAEGLSESAEKLIETLKNFRVNARVVDICRGPTVTRFEIALATGTRVNTVKNLADDISYALATNGVRIEQIPGKSAIGIEVPNMGVRDTVYLRSLLADEKFTGAKSKLTTALGKGVSGENVYLDIAKMPHLLIAGTTGSGKSVCINTMLISLLYKATPDEVKLVLVDPKKVELNIYNGIPHLLVPVVFDPKKAAGALHWCVTEMERRFDLIESMNVRNIDGYNKAIEGDPNKEKLPQIVIVIDELADLMMTASNEVETSICRIAQKARAAGMHLIIGTQRPSVDVITGLIKANVPSRIAFTVMSQVDSRTIIDSVGAEKLVGRGDMLYAPVGSKPMRAQGAFVSDAELEGIIDFIKENAKKAEYSGEIMARIEKEAALCGKKGKARDEAADAMASADDEEDNDPKLDAAIKLAVESGKISTSLIQRKLSLGYGRAAKLIDAMERRGIVAPPEGQKPRQVLITKEQYLEMSMRTEGAAGAAPKAEPANARAMQRTGEMPSASAMQRTGEVTRVREDFPEDEI
jgi:S-DNA-T family DNA segregation ATPase FtsK/SpoIIIE